MWLVNLWERMQKPTVKRGVASIKGFFIRITSIKPHANE